MNIVPSSIWNFYPTVNQTILFPFLLFLLICYYVTQGSSVFDVLL